MVHSAGLAHSCSSPAARCQMERSAPSGAAAALGAPVAPLACLRGAAGSVRAGNRTAAQARRAQHMAKEMSYAHQDVRVVVCSALGGRHSPEIAWVFFFFF